MVIVAFVAGVVVGTVVSYLYYRANKNKKAAVDAFVDKTRARL
jgi:uncharacterized membrane-anchored protein YhcB (DUF1043 family)